MSLIEVSGSTYECGLQVGQNPECRQSIHELISWFRQNPPRGLNRDQIHQTAAVYLPYIDKYYPKVAGFLRGVAEGALIDYSDLISTVEEISETDSSKKACTDIIITPPKTAGEILVGHNNDSDYPIGKLPVVVLAHLDNGLDVLTIGGDGVFVSSGANSSGLVCTGNNLTANDVREWGIPRSVLAIAMLYAKNIDQAFAVATHPFRASSYNNVLTDWHETVGIEASAFAYAVQRPDAEGVYAHANSYLNLKMEQYEGFPGYQSSILRQTRADSLAHSSSHLNLTDLQNMLRDHGPDDQCSDDTICRHGPTNTFFAMTADMSTGQIDLCPENPCQGKFETIWEIPKKR